MKSQLELWSHLLDELGERCSVSTARDLETVTRRYTHEGDKFFTVTLPAFGKDFERSLSVGYIPADAFQGWKSRNRRSAYQKYVTSEETQDLLTHVNGVGEVPVFLGEFLDRVFDPSNGALYDGYPGLYEPGCIDSIHAVRQLTLAFGKLKVLPDQEQVDEAFRGYVELESQIIQHAQHLTDTGEILQLGEELKSVVNHVFGDVLRVMDRKVYEGELVPKHGPGATAERKLGNQKYYQRYWTERMEPLFPFVDWAVPSFRYASRVVPRVKWLSLEDEIPSRVIAVPKTARSPRIIAAEPVALQYMQQAIASTLVRELERKWNPEEGRPNLSYFFTGFSDQRPNQAMAQIGSEDGSLATLDLSEASDRVPNWLVELVFEDYPWFSEAVQVTRSRRADVPGYGVLDLAKFASMGSALTFPIEAMIFVAASLLGIAKAEGAQFSYRFFFGLRDQVRVYGDDIVVPTVNADSVVESLEAFGFKVNKDKSFWTGMFRESCGKEYYRGEDVSIVKFRQELPTQRALRRSGNGLKSRSVATDDADWTKKIQSAVSTRNLFYEHGLWKVAACLDEVLEALLEGWYPFVAETSPVLGRHSFTYAYDTHGTTRDTQSPFVKGLVPYSVLPVNPVDDWAALMKVLLSANIHMSDEIRQVDDDHLKRSGRPQVAGIKLAKAQPF